MSFGIFHLQFIVMLGIDCHCHLEYMRDPENVIAEARKKMAGIVTSIADPKHIKEIMQLADTNSDFVFVALGLHPTHVFDYDERAISETVNFIKHNKSKLVAVGETGLDYHHITEKEKIEATKNIFSDFIEVANETDLPLVIHSRNAMPDTLKMLEAAKVPVMMHFFSGNDEELQICLERGYFISFTTLTAGSKKFRKLAKKTPLENMLLETDGPWLDPDPPADLKNEPYSPFNLTNRPWKIHITAEKLEKELKIQKDEILKITTENAKRLFGIKSQ